MTAGTDEARSIALKVIRRVERGEAFIAQALDMAFKSSPGIKEIDKEFATEISYGTIRHKGRIEAILRHFCAGKFSKINPQVLGILKIGVYQLLYMSKVPPYAAVHSSVELARRCGNPWAASHINAVLRKVQSGGQIIPGVEDAEDQARRISITHSHPAWMVDLWIEMFGVQETERLCRFNNERPPLTLRANGALISRDDLAEFLSKKGFKAHPTPFSNTGVILDKRSEVTSIPGYIEGLFIPQDEGSQLIGQLLSPRKGNSILDVCAGIGGKVTLAAYTAGPKGKVLALDLSHGKLSTLRQTTERLGIKNIHEISADSASENYPLRNILFDRVLIDPPCTDLGTLRRHPEVKWRRKKEDIKRLAIIQSKMLDYAVRFVKHGGTAVYSTCTITKEENEDIIKEFLENRKDFKLVDCINFLPDSCAQFKSGDLLFRTFPAIGSMDGLFAAVMTRIQ